MRRSVRSFCDGLRGLSLTDEEYVQCLDVISTGRFSRSDHTEVEVTLPAVGSTAPSPGQIRLDCLGLAVQVRDPATPDPSGDVLRVAQLFAGWVSTAPLE